MAAAAVAVLAARLGGLGLAREAQRLVVHDLGVEGVLVVELVLDGALHLVALGGSRARSMASAGVRASASGSQWAAGERDLHGEVDVAPVPAGALAASIPKSARPAPGRRPPRARLRSGAAPFGHADGLIGWAVGRGPIRQMLRNVYGMAAARRIRTASFG